MTLYTFHMCDTEGFSTCFETRELPFDSAAFPVSGELLAQHPTADHVSVWDDDRPVLARHREPPSIRGLRELRVV